MECLRPNKGYYNSEGIHVFGKSPNGHETEHDLPCGYCDHCRTGKAKLKGFKTFSTAITLKDAIFITFTYGKHYPITPSGLATLDNRPIPLFCKRLRNLLEKQFISDYGREKFKKLSKDEKKSLLRSQKKISMIYNGEYGDGEDRPHYHAILYNHSFDDCYYWRTSKKGFPLYRSPTLEKLWPHGFTEIGEVTPASSTYVASYIYKKQYGEKAKEHYKDRKPEFVISPKKNFVLGRDFIHKNIDYIAEQGCFKTIEGHSIGIDTHTLQWIEKEYPDHALKIKLAKESFNVQKLTNKQKRIKEDILKSKKQLTGEK